MQGRRALVEQQVPSCVLCPQQGDSAWGQAAAALQWAEGLGKETQGWGTRGAHVSLAFPPCGALSSSALMARLSL